MAAETKENQQLDGELISPEERARILSAGRLKLTLTVFVTVILVGLSALMFSGVDRIFSWLTPSIRKDLEHKAVHGAVELAQSAQIGLVTEDTRAIAEAVAEYDRDRDVTGLLIVTHEGGKVLYSKSQLPANAFAALLSRKPGVVHDLGSKYGAWLLSEIEGAPIGSVAVLVSKARLAAGEQLRREVLQLAVLGFLAALGASLLFVSMYIGPILRVTGRTFERLERTTEAALAAARLKSEFLANMSHEIRTPMNGIIGVLDLLTRTPLSPKQRRYAQTIDNSARGLLTIINDILDFSKLEAGKYDVRQDDLELSQLVQDASELLSPKAHAKGLDLVVRTAPNVPERVRGDFDRLKQILINLLGNAIKFTEQGHVQLQVSLDESGPDYHMLRFSVTDTGVGIHPDDQARLFAVFSQVDGSLTRKYGGTGLGLAISRRIAEAMGGQCGVESEPGKGSTFWFTARVATAAADAAAEDGKGQHEANVLLVSSSALQRSVLRELIGRWGMQIEVAESAEHACELVLGHPGGFNAAIVDGGGLDPVAPDGPNLTELCLGEGVPVIRLLSTTEVAAEAAPDAQTYLWKPVRASELYNSIVALSTGHEITLRQRLQQEQETLEEGEACGRVLVVDDNEVNRLVACELLSELGYESDTASNGQEAFDKVEGGAYDVVLMDCQMPGVDGFAATTMIRELPNEKARVPIIALTAHAMADDRDRVLRAGMDDYATKPIRGRVLAALLKRWVPGGNASSGNPAAQAPQPSAQSPQPPAEQAQETELQLDPTLPRSARVVELFLQTVPELLRTLTAAMEAKDVSKTKQLSHKLKGNCLSIGANRMAGACHAVELAAAAGRLDHGAHARIAPELAAVTALLTPVLQRQPSNDEEAASA